jgi:hydroxyethylthiazole kinase-like uncharacterized protein yjeF
MVIALLQRGWIRALAPYLAQAHAVLIGPGMDDAVPLRPFVRDALARMREDVVVVLDAAAIRAADVIQSPPGASRDVDQSQAPRQGIITPHSGEMADLLDLPRDEVDAYAPDVARHAAERFGCVVALKGATTFIAAGDELYRFDGGTVGLATSGSGDTLAGVVAGLAAHGADPLTATLWGVWAHGTAGARLAKRVNRVGFLARELLAELPKVLRR